MKQRITVPLIALLLTLQGCGNAHERATSVMPPLTAPQQYTEPEQRVRNPGSLYNDSDSVDLYADNRARRVGDIVLIKIVENSKSKSKADTTTDKSSTSQFGVSAAFGRNTISPVTGIGGIGATGVGVDPLFASSTSTNLKATGETKRENYVTATIGARVLQVLPGGLLQVQGAREIRVNNETQYMVVTGLVRARDIAADNSVTSTQMADSRIEYYGEGVLADKQKSGWLSRLLENVWPF